MCVGRCTIEVAQKHKQIAEAEAAHMLPVGSRSPLTNVLRRSSKRDFAAICATVGTTQNTMPYFQSVYRQISDPVVRREAGTHTQYLDAARGIVLFCLFKVASS